MTSPGSRCGPRSAPMRRPTRSRGSRPETLRQRRVALGGRGTSIVLRRGVAIDGQHPLVDGIVARFDRPGRISGTLSVAGRPDGCRFDADARTLLEALAGLLGDALTSDRMVEELRASRDDLQRLAALVAGSDDAIIGVAADGTVTSWNPAAAALFGQPAEAVLGRPAAMLAVVGTSPRMSDAFARARAGEQTRDVHVDARRPDGSVIPVSATVSPVRANGTIVGVSVIARDVTARTLQDTVIRESLDRFESVFEGSPIGMGVVGGDFEWVRANDALCRTLGVAGDQLVGRRFELSLLREDIEPAHGLVSRVLRGETDAAQAELRFRSAAHGDPMVASLTVRVLRTPGLQPQVLCTLEDVTERRRAEARAREMKARAQQAIIDLTRIREPEAVLRSAVRAARDATGAEVAVVRLPDPAAWGRWQVIGEDGGSGLLGTLLDGERLLLLGATRGTTRMPASGEPAAWPFMTADFRSFLGTPIALDDGGAGILVLANKEHGAVFDDDDVAMAEALATQVGVSLENARAHDRALALVRELDDANGALQAASAARSQFLANVSHELRTPLHAILLAAQQLADPTIAGRDPRRSRTLPATIEGSGRYLLGLIDDLVDLSRIELSELRIDPVEVELGPLLGAVDRQLSALADEQHVVLDIPSGSRQRVVADPLRLRQVLVNLVSNAIKYTPPGGVVHVTVRAAKGQATIAVQDTGIGIAAGDLERVFQPFERLAIDTAPGAGLGLPIARRIMELHGGHLSATSEPGIGSTFTLHLPRPVRSTAPGRELTTARPRSATPASVVPHPPSAPVSDRVAHDVVLASRHDGMPFPVGARAVDVVPLFPTPG